MHKISVIIPVYNVEKYLSECIESVINQTYKNLEIILVNDGSTDSCPQICDAYASRDKRIKVIHKKNEGSAEARNTGMKLVTGDFIGFVDSDDLLSKDFYKTLMYLLEKNNADIVECGFYEFKNINEICNRQTHKDSSLKIFDTEAAMKAIMEGPLSVVIWNKLYKKALLQEISFPTGKYIDDVFWTYKVFGNARKIVKIKDKLYFYRQQTGSIMRSGFSLRRLDALQGHEEKIEYMKKKFPKLENLAVKVFCFVSIHHYQELIKHNNLDPEKIYRNSIYIKVKNYYKWYVLKNWHWKDIIWFLLFIYSPKNYRRFREYIEFRATKKIKQDYGKV